MKEQQKQAIENYIHAYNAFDISGMVKDLHPNVVFENITNDEVDLTTKGIEEFKIQAEKAKQYFTERKQIIESWNFEDNQVTIDIDYEGVLAIDLPGGAMAGDTLALKGKSEFFFSDDKIIGIKDFS